MVENEIQTKLDAAIQQTFTDVQSSGFKTLQEKLAEKLS